MVVLQTRHTCPEYGDNCCLQIACVNEHLDDILKAQNVDVHRDIIMGSDLWFPSSFARIRRCNDLETNQITTHNTSKVVITNDTTLMGLRARHRRSYKEF